MQHATAVRSQHMEHRCTARGRQCWVSVTFTRILGFLPIDEEHFHAYLIQDLVQHFTQLGHERCDQYGSKVVHVEAVVGGEKEVD